jgi:glucosamine-6-phosphate deaminase
MRIDIAPDKLELGRRAAADGAALLRQALLQRGRATILVATGASQLETLSNLVEAPGIDWSKVTCFHLDEYVGLTQEHSASFRKYLKERFVDCLPVPPAAFHYVNGEANPLTECQRLGDLIRQHAIDVAFMGIGENGHLAFNDPPADFQTTEPYLVVELDTACRQQQFGEGWFPSLEAVPKQAISLSIRQLMQAAALICSVSDARKANAVTAAVMGPLTPECPASILRLHANCTLYLDPPATSGLKWLY